MPTTVMKTYLEQDLAREVARLARSQGRSESSVIAEVLRSRFAASSDGAAQASEASQRRQLARLEARVDKIVRDQALLKESVFVFVRVWLEHNPPIEDELAESVAASAEARFERFLDLVAHGLQPGRSMANGDHAAAPNGADLHTEADAQA